MDTITDPKFLQGMLAGTVVPWVAAQILPQLSKWVISGTAVIIPPIVHAVKSGMVIVLSHPLAKPIIIKNKDNIRKLEDALANSITAIILAVDTAFDETLDEAAKLPEPKELPKP